MNHKGLTAALSALLLVWSTACARPPQAYREMPDKHPVRSLPADPQVIRGQQNVLLDGLGHYVISLPYKLILWNWQVDRHKISEENEIVLRRYLEVNRLDTVQVRLNSYAPHKEFARLRRNKDVHGGYRYTIGVVTWIFTTILPGRLIGGDYYDPFTNTIHIFSNHPAVLVHEGGHAKDFSHRKHRGTYALGRILPFFDSYQEWIASEDAIRYFHCRHEEKYELNAYPILFPAWGTYAGSFAGWMGQAVAVTGGHVYGRYYRKARREQLENEPADAWQGDCWTSYETHMAVTPE